MIIEFWLQFCVCGLVTINCCTADTVTAAATAADTAADTAALSRIKLKKRISLRINF